MNDLTNLKEAIVAGKLEDAKAIVNEAIEAGKIEFTPEPEDERTG